MRFQKRILNGTGFPNRQISNIRFETVMKNNHSHGNIRVSVETTTSINRSSGFGALVTFEKTESRQVVVVRGSDATSLSELSK